MNIEKQNYRTNFLIFLRKTDTTKANFGFRDLRLKMKNLSNYKVYQRRA